MAIKNSLIFGGVSSADYGIFISGEGTFNTPERAVEFVTIPGRNGALAIDQGRYENITVEYPIFVPSKSQAGFRSKIAEFRNAIASQKGYQRLTDTYNPDEYRLGMYVDGLEVEPWLYNTTGSLTLRFNCKPQRYLLTGEEEITIATSESIINPTLHDAEPLLAIEGYGTIAFNGYEIEIDNVPMGIITLLDDTSIWPLPYVYTIPSGMVNVGDIITISGFTVCTQVSHFGHNYSSDPTVTNTDSNVASSISHTGANYNYYNLLIKMPDITITTGTNYSYSNTTTAVGVVTTGETVTHTVSITLSYDATARTITYNFTRTYSVTDDAFTAGGGYSTSQTKTGTITADSSVLVFGHPTYIDCDLGEAYMIKNGDYISINQYIDLGSDLPKLAPGENEFTIDNTITELEVTPRFWQL